MKHWIEGSLFAALAIAAHVAIFANIPADGSEDAGAGGEALISLAGAAPTVREMVQKWERPPETRPILEETFDTPDMDIAPRAEVRLAMSEPEDTATPEIDTTPAPPPPEPKPELEPEPEPEDIPDTAQNAETTSAGRAEQRAAGSGDGSQAGASAETRASTASKGRQAKLRAVWGAKIRASIARRQRYPSGGRGDAAVVVTLTVSRDGQLLNYGVARSSGSAAFDQAALRAVASARRFRKAPRDLPGSQFSFSLKLVFNR